MDEDGLRAAARLLRSYHDAVRTARRAWNIVWDGFDPVGLLDREYAHVAPADRHLLG